MAFLKENNHIVFEISTAPSPENLKPLISRNISKRIILLNLTLSLFDKITKGRFLTDDRIIKRIKTRYQLNLKNYTKEKYDFIWVEDVMLLPIVIKAFKYENLIFDAREYYPEQRVDIYFKLTDRIYFDYILRNLLKHCTNIFTVSETIAELYNRNYGVKPDILLSTPYHDASIKEIINNRHENQRITFVYHGSADKKRNVNMLIEIFRNLDNSYHLYLYLVGTPKEIFKLEHFARNKPNIHFLQPVQLESIIREMKKYDVGIIFFPPSTLNLKYGLGNKFFENIHSGLAMIVGPSIEMMRIVKERELGIVTGDFTKKSLMKAVISLNRSDIEFFKANSRFAAKYYNFQTESKKLLRILNQEKN